MLWTIFVALLILWMLGLVNDFGGAAIHLLLVVAALVLVFTLLGSRKTAI
ncbi:MAG TPA: lmo0937 family membrane protein [Blastocatellia bacterium]|nr:lmo0937 family membrane protein [Blastocatellia bacterium]